MNNHEIEIVPGRLGRLGVSRGIDRAAAQLRREFSAGGAALVVDETAASSSNLRELMKEFGVALADQWDPGFVDSSSSGTLNLARPERERLDDLENKHLADSLLRLSESSHPIVLVINPADGSPAITEAIRSGASVYALPRHKTSLPLDAGMIVPWRRAIDLTPILFAIRPSNHLEWRAQYRQRGMGDVANLETIKESRVTLRIKTRAEPTRQRGGRLTLASMHRTPESDDQFERLGILTTVRHDPDEWIVGGKMIGPDRAIQVARGESPDEFVVQLVWGGTDPRPAELLALETEVVSLIG